MEQTRKVNALAEGRTNEGRRPRYNMIKMEIWFLFPAHHLMMLYICSNFHENRFLQVQSFRADTIFILNITCGKHVIVKVVIFVI